MKEYAVFKTRDGICRYEEKEIVREHLASITDARNYIRERRDAGHVNTEYEVWFLSDRRSMKVEEAWIDSREVIHSEYVYEITVNGLPQGYLYSAAKSEDKRRAQAWSLLNMRCDRDAIALRKIDEKGGWL